jgi:CheY-like chemotaxis protein
MVQTCAPASQQGTEDRLAASSSLKDFSVLVIDDDLVFLEMVVGLLEMIGIVKVARADSGSHAVEAMKDAGRVFDCVICDCKMMNGNGLELLKAVRLGKIKYLRPDSCFILLTSAAEPEIVSMAKQLDVNAYLVKPVTMEKLEATIAKARGRYFPLDFKKYEQVLVPPDLY